MANWFKKFGNAVGMLNLLAASLGLISFIRLFYQQGELGFHAVLSYIVQYYDHVFVVPILYIFETYVHISIDRVGVYLLGANIILLTIQYRAVMEMKNMRFMIIPAQFILTQAFAFACETNIFSRPIQDTAPLIAVATWFFVTLTSLGAEYVINPKASETARYLRLCLVQGTAVMVMAALLSAIAAYS